MTRENSFYVRHIKRLLDIFVAIIVIMCFWWIFVLCALCIVVDSGFPIIYRQCRIGRAGKAFTIYKFRTMVQNADKTGPLSTAVNDSRITKIGRWLRTTSLDELPQIINILKGDMSLIGFRPDVERENQEYSQNKYLLRPGLTGYAQVNGRSSLSAEEREYWENRYVREVSFALDIKILLKTAEVVFRQIGTN